MPSLELSKGEYGVSSGKYGTLLEPAYIGSVKTRSRLIKTGANPGFYPYDNGMVQQPIVDYYEALAAGGAGIVTVGSGEIDYPIGTVPNHGYRLDGDEYVPSLKKLADAIHKHDCPAFIQILHLGPMHPSAFTGLQSIAASALTREQLPRADFSIPKEMDHDEVLRVKERFVNAARNAQKAGFDGVELNAGCNHLINSFLSRRWNKRHDEYGCDSMENRCRFLTEIIQEIKAACGKDFAADRHHQQHGVGAGRGHHPRRSQGDREAGREGRRRLPASSGGVLQQAQGPHEEATARTSPTWRATRSPRPGCPRSSTRAVTDRAAGCRPRLRSRRSSASRS